MKNIFNKTRIPLRYEGIDLPPQEWTPVPDETYEILITKKKSQFKGEPVEEVKTQTSTRGIRKKRSGDK